MKRRRNNRLKKMRRLKERKAKAAAMTKSTTQNQGNLKCHFSQRRAYRQHSRRKITTSSKMKRKKPRLKTAVAAAVALTQLV